MVEEEKKEEQADSVDNAQHKERQDSFMPVEQEHVEHKEPTPVASHAHEPIQIDENRGSNEDSEVVHEKVVEIEEKPRVYEEPVKEVVKKEEKQQETTDDEESDDTAIDFGAAKKKITGFFNGLSSKKKENKEEKAHKGSEKSEEFSFDVRKGIDFTKKNAKWLIPIAFILFAIFLSSFFRMAPSTLPITDDWAQNTVNNFYRNNIEQQINAQYPNLPQQDRDALVNRELQNALEANKDQVAAELEQVSNQFKANFQDDNGDTYLLAIDPYLWWGEARNVINHGHLGDKIVDGESIQSLRNGRVGLKSSLQLHPYIGAYFYRFLHFFNRDISLMRAIFLLPAVIIGLALVPTFLIGRKMAGNVGGFFAAVFLAINDSLLRRTPAGFADTDPYNILFPLLISWLFIEAYTTEKSSWRWGLSIFGGFFVGVYAATWSGWSQSFLFVLAALGLVFGFNVIKKFRDSKYKISPALIMGRGFNKLYVILIAFFVSSGVFVTLFDSFRQFSNSFMRPIDFISIKEVGVKSIWPNVLTTVAEFNTTSFSNIIGQMGGNLLFWIALMGVVFLLFNRENANMKNWIYLFGSALYYISVLNFRDQLNNPIVFIGLILVPVIIGLLKILWLKEDIKVLYPIFLILWLLGTAFAFTKGIRFAILVAPAFALLLGVTLGSVYEKASVWLKSAIRLDIRVSKVLVLAVLALLLITPLSTAEGISKNQVPSMNDAWFIALSKIKDDGPRAITTSWWDFGHWFATITERSVTFDGADQKRRIHWVGKTLLSDDEDEAIGVLRMLNCVQEAAPDKLDEFTRDTLESVEILYDIFPIHNREEARLKYVELGLTAEQAVIMLDYTHCDDLIPNYYITSQDMIGKSGVWGHFGSWDFRRATMFQSTKSLERSEAVAYLTERFDISEEAAHSTHSEIQNSVGDQWIAPWPAYISGPQGCQKNEENQLRCEGALNGQGIAFIIDLDSYSVEIEGNPDLFPNAIVYPVEDNIVVKEFSGNNIGFSIVLIPNGNSYNMLMAHPFQAKSMFTRLYFLNGHGLKCMSKFDDRNQVTGGRIATWKVDWDCSQDNNVFFAEEAVVAEVVQEVEVVEEHDAGAMG